MKENKGIGHKTVQKVTDHNSSFYVDFASIFW